MDRIVVTGCAGFIGSRTASMLLEQGKTVIGLDNLNNYYDVRVKKHRLEKLQQYQRFRFYEMDIENKGALEIIFSSNDPDAVINLAARAGVRYSLIDPYVYLSTNTRATLNLLELMRERKISKMVLASTSSLYAGMEMPFTEDLPVLRPISPYASTKLGAETMCYSYHSLYNLDISVVRYFTVYGEAGRPDMSIFRFIKWIAEETPLILFGDGSQSRDFTFIDDIAKGTIKALNPVGYEVINLGGGHNPIALNEVISKIEKYVGKKAIINQKPFHKADLTATWADISKAKRLLDWEPEIDLDTGIKRCVDWYFENQSWLEDVKC